MTQKPIHLHPFQVSIALTNPTTRYRLQDEKKFLGSDKPADEGAHLKVEFSEILPKGLVIEAPKGCASVGHHINLEISVNEISTSLSAKVSEHEPASQNRVRLSLQLMQFDQKAWDSFCGMFAQRQTAVTDLFLKMKGDPDRDS